MFEVYFLCSKINKDVLRYLVLRDALYLASIEIVYSHRYRSVNIVH